MTSLYIYYTHLKVILLKTIVHYFYFKKTMMILIEFRIELLY